MVAAPNAFVSCVNFSSSKFDSIGIELEADLEKLSLNSLELGVQPNNVESPNIIHGTGCPVAIWNIGQATIHSYLTDLGLPAEMTTAKRVDLDKASKDIGQVVFQLNGGDTQYVNTAAAFNNLLGELSVVLKLFVPRVMTYFEALLDISKGEPLPQTLSIVVFGCGACPEVLAFYWYLAEKGEAIPPNLLPMCSTTLATGSRQQRIFRGLAFTSLTCSAMSSENTTGQVKISFSSPLFLSNRLEAPQSKHLSPRNRSNCYAICDFWWKLAHCRRQSSCLM